MKFERKLTSADRSVYEQIEWTLRDASIPGADFYMPNVEVPAHWSQTATNVLAQKYFRKAGVPNYTRAYVEEDVPNWLCRRVVAKDIEVTFSSEISASRVFHRMVGCWTYWGWKGKYFIDEDSARAFYDECFYMLAMQFAAPNSPQWFNCGLHWAYGIEGEDSGLWRVDDQHEFVLGGTRQLHNSYEHPQVHACYIQPVEDKLVGPGSMLELWEKEARLFKHGSGTGTNFSKIRGKGEPLSGGGVSSGLMSFLRVGDSNAGSIKSGGVTRRAAKMVVLDIDHPEVEDFIDWKVREESKAAAMYVGSQALQNYYQNIGDARQDPFIAVPEAVVDRMNNSFEPKIFEISGMEAPAIASVDGQNSNNSIRIINEFLIALTEDQYWGLTNRIDGEVCKWVTARDLWNRICRAAWACGDPGLQFHDTINAWHTCKTAGNINASNPCSEYLFLDNTACNLASLNLCKFLSDTNEFDCGLFEHAVRIWTTVLDISVSMASYPSKEIAEGSYNYRTLGLGYANLGGLLAKMKLSYDSDDGRVRAADITALMTGVAYLTSREIAGGLGSFPKWGDNYNSMNAVIKKHQASLTYHHSRIHKRANWYWGMLSTPASFRNAQVTLIAPTGTIALIMDCETTGIEPYYSRKSVKSLAGGGTMLFEHDIADSECAVPSEPGGSCLSPEAHIRMVAAVQPFLSGGISKTVNLPNSATVDDVSHTYLLAHKLGLKSISLYRDGSKLTQPLVTGANKTDANATTSQITYRENENSRARGTREPLPSRRIGYTQKFRIDDQAVFLRTGEYPDSRRLGEIFLNISRGESFTRSITECLAKSISIGLQYGVPLSEFVEAFVNVKFEPAGMVQGDDRIKFCSSIMDLIARHLGVEYLGRDDLAHVPSTPVAERILMAAQEFEKALGVHRAPAMIMSGEVCSACGGMLRISGTCKTCADCGATSGCG